MTIRYCRFAMFMRDASMLTSVFMQVIIFATLMEVFEMTGFSDILTIE